MRPNEKSERDNPYNVLENPSDSAQESFQGEPSSQGREPAGHPKRNTIGPTPRAGQIMGYGKRMGLAADRLDESPSPSASASRDVDRFHRRVNIGKVKLCGSCGGVMVRSTRMVLSPVAGLVLILLGAAFMAGYGMATNFYQTAWYLKFALPALYYIGSLFIGIGVLFFFIREKVWKCSKCRDIRKR